MRLPESFVSCCEVSVRTLLFATSLLAAVSAVMPNTAFGQHDHHGSEVARYGLGQRFPDATDLSLMPTWRVYAFERDGISYYQVNDELDQVQIIIAKAGDEFWSLPAGSSRTPVLLPSDPQGVLPAADRRVVFTSEEFALALYDDGVTTLWSVEYASW